MTEWSAEQYCNTCRKTTSHTETLVRKPSSYDSDTSLLGRIKLSLHTIINGGNYYNMDRYVTCKTCHTKELKNQGNEFE